MPAGVFVREWALQALVLLALILLFGWVANNLLTNLADRGITVGFDWLTRAARFPISESVLPYSSTDTFGWAFVVGFTNSLFLSALVLACSTTLGFIIALARRSQHPLARGSATTFVEATRNTPLVVQLLFWYAVITFGLPPMRSAFNPLPGVFLTDRGLTLPRLDAGGGMNIVIFVALLGLAITVWAATVARRRRIASGQSSRIGIGVACAAAAVTLLVGWIVSPGIDVKYAVMGRFNFMGGTVLTPEFVAITLGLVLYSSAFTSEIIRGGIEAVNPGQWEAGRAVGLTERQTLRLVVLPQALRVIVPPMTSQFINIIKNSTLALVVGFPDLNFVTATTINQTGQALEGIVILMLAFLLVSALASLLMNWYHRRLALSEQR
jgi:general L-amino acid transport system permease protein